jgi:hypothetical protein
MSNVTYSPSHRQAGAPVINIQSTLRTAPDLCKNVSLAVLLCTNGNSYTMCVQSDVYIYIYICVCVCVCVCVCMCACMYICMYGCMA